MTLKIAGLVGTAIAVAAIALPAAVGAGELEDRVQQLEQELILLRRQLESQVKQAKETADKAIEQAGQQAGVSARLKGPTPIWESEDGRFKAELDGRIHYDIGFFGQNDQAPNSAQRGEDDLSTQSNFRRARFGLKGTMDKDWAYRIIFDAGDSDTSGVVNADVIDIAYLGFHPFKFTLGKHKVPNGMEILTSSNDIPFIERAQVSNISVTTVFGGDEEIGLKRMGFSVGAGGDFWHGRAGTFFDSDDFDGGDMPLSLHARAGVAPVNEDDMMIHLGASGWHLFEPPQRNDATTQSFQLRDRPELRVDGNRLIDTGPSPGSVDDASMWGVELAARWKMAWLMAEYAATTWSQSQDPLDRTVGGGAIEDAEFEGYYVSAGVFLTGESRPYNARDGVWKGLRVRRPFSLSTGGLGAWELLARFSHLNLDDSDAGILGGIEDNWTLGVNWYPNDYVMFKLNYINARIDRENAAGLEIGQNVDIIGLRTAVKW
ncbi:MAG: porin [Alphaproteobacteria bacterium]|nr:porin [Alphaproteobacteria bacterium]